MRQYSLASSKETHTRRQEASCCVVPGKPTINDSKERPMSDEARSHQDSKNPPYKHSITADEIRPHVSVKKHTIADISLEAKPITKAISQA
ncbi:unnamed protein product [Dovyalis caffra]|uniref:Uncharacterized protein n=1 Tax=Dovyalis caffra TaxID=77055 RepID=A0AAV1SGR1_9ROSI|nr:unnamed protein product [Dovyalis caffra]